MKFIKSRNQNLYGQQQEGKQIFLVWVNRIFIVMYFEERQQMAFCPINFYFQ